MKVDKILQQEQQANNQPKSNGNPSAPLNYPGTNPSSLYYGNQMPAAPTNQNAALYPTMNSYMDLDLTPSEIEIIERQQQQLYALQLAQTRPNEVATYANKSVIAPISGNSVGMKRAQVINGIREVILCKDADHKIGMRCKAINNGIFVVLVTQGSPASLAGLRFGDQILQVLDLSSFFFVVLKKLKST